MLCVHFRWHANGGSIGDRKPWRAKLLIFEQNLRCKPILWINPTAENGTFPINCQLTCRKLYQNPFHYKTNEPAIRHPVAKARPSTSYCIIPHLYTYYFFFSRLFSRLTDAISNSMSLPAGLLLDEVVVDNAVLP